MEVHEKGKLLERAVKDGDGIVNMDKLGIFCSCTVYCYI